jgi:hypothetical protein
LDLENAALLSALQASQGLIGVQTERSEIVIHVCLREDNEAITEDLDDLVSELDALLFGLVEPPVQVTVTKYIGETDAYWPPLEAASAPPFRLPTVPGDLCRDRPDLLVLLTSHMCLGIVPLQRTQLDQAVSERHRHRPCPTSARSRRVTARQPSGVGRGAAIRSDLRRWPAATRRAGLPLLDRLGRLRF